MQTPTESSLVQFIGWKLGKIKTNRMFLYPAIFLILLLVVGFLVFYSKGSKQAPKPQKFDYPNVLDQNLHLDVSKIVSVKGVPSIVAKDLPRLASRLIVHIKDKENDEKIPQMISFLLNLSKLLELNIDKDTILEDFKKKVSFNHHITVQEFLEDNFGHIVPMCTILNSITQATLAPSVTSLKILFIQKKLDFKDGQWNIEVSKEKDNYLVYHKRLEKGGNYDPICGCKNNMFNMRWNLELLYDKNFKLNRVRMNLEEIIHMDTKEKDFVEKTIKGIFSDLNQTCNL